MGTEQTTKENTIAIPVHYSGEMVKEIRKKIMECITKNEGKEIYLDFSGTQFVDSCAIGSLVSIAKEATQRDTI
ncbi:MAG: STAS domain-containing protein, partial [Chitinispirillaceae bacterium]|nr:STAS domain-containing protein [Chitinispirillaceae bacterium]